jgi:hypothetical protein
VKGLDTNVLVRYVTADDPEQAEVAREMIEGPDDSDDYPGKTRSILVHMVYDDGAWSEPRPLRLFPNAPHGRRTCQSRRTARGSTSWEPTRWMQTTSAAISTSGSAAARVANGLSPNRFPRRSTARRKKSILPSSPTAYCPMVTPDGKYLFFSRRRSDPPDGGWPRVVVGDVYWVDAAVIERLRPAGAEAEEGQ